MIIESKHTTDAMMECKLASQTGDTPDRVGRQLAVITRQMAVIFVQALKLKDSERENMEARIAESYQKWLPKIAGMSDAAFVKKSPPTQEGDKEELS